MLVTLLVTDLIKVSRSAHIFVIVGAGKNKVTLKFLVVKNTSVFHFLLIVRGIPAKIAFKSVGSHSSPHLTVLVNTK